MRARVSLVLILLFLAARPAPAREGTSSASLAARLEARVAAGRMRSDQVGVAVVDLDSGQALYAKSETLLLIPASVAKVVTTVAALDLLGPGWRYDTTIDARGAIDPATGTLSGDLVVHGSGDPNLSKRLKGDDWLYPLNVLADGVAAVGIRKVSGALVLDDGAFDRVYLHPSWEASDVRGVSGAPVGGLSFNDNCLTVIAQGSGAMGRRAAISLPATSGPWTIANGTEIVGGGNGGIGGRWSADDPKTMSVFGNVVQGRSEGAEIPVPDPGVWFGGALERVLASKGVVVSSVRLAATPADRAAGRRLATVSDGLPETLRVMNHRSQNFYAEILFKTCGAAREGSGSWESGERALRDVLERHGIVDPRLRVVDGSGLSRENRLTAGALASLLRALDADPIRGPILHASLATPGADGTLERRFREPSVKARVHAKTGTLKGVYSLCGYLDGAAPSRGYAFAILLNGSPADGDPRDLIDDLVREMARE